MDIELKILIVEDSEIDAELIERELKKSGFNLYSERVETRESMTKALVQKEWDLILCDNKMPKFNSVEALKLKKELRPDLPFIIVSDHITDELVFKFMKDGCRDYILKGSLTSLGKIVRRELERR